MKRLFYTLVLFMAILSCPRISNAQITLEHTFDSPVYFSSSNFIYYYGDANYYMSFSSTDNQIKIYNIDYSLYKTVTITPPSGYQIVSVSYLTKTLFNSNDKLEFFVQFTGPTTDYSVYQTLRLYDEDGIVIKDFGFSYSINPSIHKINNQYRLSVVRYIYSTTILYITEIYSLPGSMSYSISEFENSNIQSPFPNPANTVINLPYKLNQGQKSIMRISNIQGQLIELKQIDYVFDKIILNVSNYSKGVYFYEVNGVSNKFVVE